MTKLHEVLAVEKTAAVAANKLVAESKKTLSKDSLFQGQTRVLRHFSEDHRDLDITTVQALTTTVRDNLTYLGPVWARWVDVTATKDQGNRTAVADIVINSVVLAKEVPATTLLGLETRLNDLRGVFEKIPTLPPGVAVQPDPTSELPGVFVTTHPTVTIKEVKDADFRRTVEADEHHPAQVEKVDISRPVGRYETSSTYGFLSPYDKAEILTRLDTLMRAVKEARARANDTSVKKVELGEELFNYVLGVD